MESEKLSSYGDTGYNTNRKEILVLGETFRMSQLRRTLSFEFFNSRYQIFLCIHPVTWQ